MSYHYLLDIAIILLTTKVFGLITKRFKLPQVVGALIAGVVFGPAVLNVLHGTEFLSQLSELGVIVIMFSAGLETDLAELKQTGKAGFLVALLGVLVPLAGGTAFGYFFNESQGGSAQALLQNVFIGVILTATSVSITVETLKEIGVLSTRVGSTILAAALIDDILGLICLTLVSSLSGDATVSIGLALLKILLFFVVAIVVGVVIYKSMSWYNRKMKDRHLRRLPIISFVFCLFMAYAAERFFGVADIIGAFAVGLAVGNTTQASYIESRFKPISYMLLTPIFFANIGISIQLQGFSLTMLVSSIVLVVLAIVTKLVGCGIGARLSGLELRQSVQVGLGMVCRGEVALIVANKGRVLGMVPDEFFGPVVVMVVVTAIVTPVFLKLAFNKEDRYAGLPEGNLVDRIEAVDQLDEVSRRLLEANSSMQKSSGKSKNK